MQQIDVSSWEHFEDRLNHLLGGHTNPPGVGNGHVSGFLYRGQSDRGWELATTLDRSEPGNLSLRQHYRLMLAVKPQVETVTDTEWSAPNLADYETWLSQRQHMAIAPLGYEYMVYLRHHGFPSPLLDWTRSPYIAAYFAFRRVHHDAKSVAIFVYREYLGQGKSWVSPQPMCIHWVVYPNSPTALSAAERVHDLCGSRRRVALRAP